MFDLLSGLFISFGGILAVVFNKPMAEEGARLNVWAKFPSTALWLGRIVTIIWGVAMFLVGAGIAVRSFN